MKLLLFCSYSLLFSYINPKVGFSQSPWRLAFPTFNKGIGELQAISDSECVVESDKSIYRLNSLTNSVDTFFLTEPNQIYVRMDWKNRDIGVLGLLQPNNPWKGRCFTRTTTDGGTNWYQWHLPEDPNIPNNPTHKSISVLLDGSFYTLLTSQLMVYVNPYQNTYKVISLPYPMEQISFFAKDSGWGIATNRLYSTTNGGVTWTATDVNYFKMKIVGTLAFIIENDSLRVITGEGVVVRKISTPARNKLIAFDATDLKNIWIIMRDSISGADYPMVYKENLGWVRTLPTPKTTALAIHSERSGWLRSRLDWYYTSGGGFLTEGIHVSNFTTHRKLRSRVYIAIDPNFQFRRWILERRSSDDTLWTKIGNLDYPNDTHWDEDLSSGKSYRYRVTVELTDSTQVNYTTGDHSFDTLRHIDLLDYMTMGRNQASYYSCRASGSAHNSGSWSSKEFHKMQRRESTTQIDYTDHITSADVFDDKGVYKKQLTWRLREHHNFNRFLSTPVFGGFSTFPPLLPGGDWYDVTLTYQGQSFALSYPISRFIDVPQSVALNPPGEIFLHVQHDLRLLTDYSYKHLQGPTSMKTSSYQIGISSTSAASLDSITTSSLFPSSSSFILHQNYPNPFNPGTTIRFSLLKYDHATLRVYDVLGKLVATLADGWLEAGEHEFRFHAEDIPSGVYLYVLQTGGNRIAKKMVVMK